MKVGVTPWDLGRRDAHGLAEQAALAESLGYESFWLPENHFNPGAIPDPLMLLAAVAASTRDIRLATTSYLLPLRHPLQAAEQVAVLDQLSSGRVTLGIGRGYAPTMLKAFSVDPGQKRALFEQCLDTMRLAWRGEPVVVGSGAQSETVVLDPLPVQQPHPPLWVAAFGPKALAQAGRLGLPYLASPVETLTALSENYLRHGEAAAAAGVSAVGTVPVMRTVFVAEDARIGRQIRERLARDAERAQRGAAVVRPETAAIDDWCIVGEAGFVRERIAEYRERLRVTHLIVTRLRIGGIQPDLVRRSVEQVPDLIDSTRGGEA